MTSRVEHVNAVVIGSGFGGSIAAGRLVEEGLSVVLLERGRLYPPGSFPRSPHKMARNFWDPSEGLYGLFDIWSFRSLEAVVSSGVGGGSLIYANVLLRKDEKWFVKNGPQGEHWPLSLADIESNYECVEEQLAPQLYPFDKPPYNRTAKTLALKSAAHELGLEWSLPKLAVTFANAGQDPIPGQPIVEAAPNLHNRTRLTCRLCGECDIGCNEGSKNSLDYTVLTKAVARGLHLRSLCEARTIAQLSGGGFETRYIQHDLGREGKPSNTEKLPTKVVQSDLVVLAAGAFGSTYLLLRSRNCGALTQLSDQLGTRVSSNGDLLTFAQGCRQQEFGDGTTVPVDANFGPVITSTIRIPDLLGGGSGRGAYIQDGGYPYFASWLAEGTNLPGLARRFLSLGWRYLAGVLRLDTDSNLSAEISNFLGMAESSSTLTLLGMGRDVPGGRMRTRGQMARYRLAAGAVETFLQCPTREDAADCRLSWRTVDR